MYVLLGVAPLKTSFYPTRALTRFHCTLLRRVNSLNTSPVLNPFDSYTIVPRYSHSTCEITGGPFLHLLVRHNPSHYHPEGDSFFFMNLMLVSSKIF